ncbi:acyl-CoA-binding domain-containing protein 6 [Homalodisca vitripennis]|nr:acyl-CoA-binding domain-containing protein 6 [Homalodisca vitripennis]KAG8270820.1 acyl-CoA binding domain-containing protein 6 [Homalodisca vitripennis]
MAEADLEMDLKERFSSAAKFLELVAGQLNSSQLLELYSYYKQATQGRCNTARPSWFNMTARQKWDAWNALGNIGQEEAMKSYVALISQLFPSWEEESEKTSASGWVSVSCMAKEEPELADTEKKLSDWVRDGEKTKVKQYATNSNIDQLDGDGLGPIHWAADRGNLGMLQFLISELNADIEFRDQDGQTALHYAASCGHADIVKYLIELGANKTVKDADGATPLEVASEPEIVSLLS